MTPSPKLALTFRSSTAGEEHGLLSALLFLLPVSLHKCRRNRINLLGIATSAIFLEWRAITSDAVAAHEASILKTIWIAPDAVLALAAGLQKFGLQPKSNRWESPILRPDALWRIPAGLVPENPFIVFRRLTEAQLAFDCGAGHNAKRPLNWGFTFTLRTVRYVARPTIIHKHLANSVPIRRHLDPR